MTAADVTRHDLIIIGTGSGNSILGPELDAWDVAIVEEGVFGGTCLNRGCIPTKMLVYPADLVQAVRHAGHLGVDARVDGVRWREIRDRVFGRIDPIAAGGEEYRTERCPNVTVHKGRGRFVDAHRVEVNGRVLEAPRIVVAAGARPMVPDLPGLAEVGYHTSDTIMRVDEVPGRLLIIGGGFIACEMAHVFESFGARVTMLVRGPLLLRGHDHDVARAFTDAVRERFDVRCGVAIRGVERHGAGVTAVLGDGTRIDADAVLVATGRVPNTDTIDAAAAGLMLHPDGRIVVNPQQRTSVDGIWALGDISSPHQLKHVANHEARVVAHNLVHPDAEISTDHRFVPHAVFSNPQVATVGLTEEQALEAGIDIAVKVQRYGDTAYGWAMEDTASFCKLIADRATRRLVGAHLFGPYAAMLVQQLIQGMAAGQTVDELARGQYYIHPALPEVVENALLGLC